MMASNTRSLAAALVAALAVAACGSAPGAAQTSPRPAPAAADTAGARWTEADVHFMSAMIGHHAQAIEMGRLAPTRAASQQVRTLAERVVNAQEDEIASMQQWLRDRGQPVPEPRPTGTAAAHHDHGAGHEGMMPGMLTPEQMRQLEEARGPEFDRLFLTLMIQHHQGAVAMVTRLFNSYGAGQDEAVFKLASDINVDQITEVNRMQRMLAELVFGVPQQ